MRTATSQALRFLGIRGTAPGPGGRQRPTRTATRGRALTNTQMIGVAIFSVMSEECACACQHALCLTEPWVCSQGGGKSAAEDDDGGARRAEMVGRLVAIARAAGLADENVHDAVMLLDRLLRLGLSREAASPAVLAGVAVLSTKQGALTANPRITLKQSKVRPPCWPAWPCSAPSRVRGPQTVGCLCRANRAPTAFLCGLRLCLRCRTLQSHERASRAPTTQ